MAALTKRYSITETRQGKELSCAYHVCCKLLLKNMVEWVHPLPIDDEQLYIDNNCNRFFDTEVMEYHDPRHFTPDMCTENGHIKIHLFRYFYQLYLNANCSRVGAVKRMHMNVPCIFEILYQNHSRQPVKRIMDEVIQLKDRLHITWSSSEVINMPGLFPAIQKIIRLGFYVGAYLIDETTCGEHASHAVHIIDTVGENQIIFKDSLGSKDHYTVNIDELFPLESDVCKKTGKPYHYRVEHCIFFLPCKDAPIGFVDTPEKMEAFHAWLDDYISHFPKLLSPSTFNVGDRVTTGTITGQIDDIVEDGFMVKYTEGTRTKVRRFTMDQLTKVGGTRRRRKTRKSRKRIR